MAGKLRVVMEGGWYRMVNRGNRRVSSERWRTRRRNALSGACGARWSRDGRVGLLEGLVAEPEPATRDSHGGVR